MTTVHSLTRDPARTLLTGLSLALLLLVGPPAGMAQEVPSDATVIDPVDRDPLAWIGDREVRFVGRTRDAIGLLSGPNENYRKVKTVAAGSLLVVVGDLAPNYLEILVPDGFRAFIHGRYLEQVSGHIWRVNADRVNLRSQPQSQGDYPITQLHTDAEVWVWGPAPSDPEWIEVTPRAAVALWTTDDEVDPIGGLTGATLDEITRLRAGFDAMFAEPGAMDPLVQASSPTSPPTPQAEPPAPAVEATADNPLAAGHERIAELLLQAKEGIAAQRQRGRAADYSTARNLLAEAARLQPDPPEIALSDSLLAEIRMHEEDRRAALERESLASRIAEEKDRLARLQTAGLTTETKVLTTPSPATATWSAGQQTRFSGFLRHRPEDPSRPLAVEQGTRVLAYVTCSSGRYVLTDFVGKQVALKGKIGTAGATPTLDVDHLEIIGP